MEIWEISSISFAWTTFTKQKLLFSFKYSQEAPAAIDLFPFSQCCE